MSTKSSIERFRRHAVPLVVFAIVAVVALAVPPIVLGKLTRQTYALTAAVVILAIGSVLPYALLVAVGTLPLLYTRIASYAAPQPTGDAHSFSAASALRHVVAGFSYVLGAAVVGAIGIGTEIATSSDTTVLPAILRPSLMAVGGVVVAAAFVGLQLWRYDTPDGSPDQRTVLGTVVLGGLLALSPLVAFWIFSNTG